MSATLTWFSSGLVAKTGTTNSALITDIVSLVNSKSGDANFKWQVASSSTAGPLYVVLKRKDGSAGRILLVIWASAPAGNVDTPSNLTASSGTIMGNDSAAVKVGGAMSVASVYGANFQVYYFDSAEAMVFCLQNPASTVTHMVGAGALLVDPADNAYDAVVSSGASGIEQLGSNSNPAFLWSSAAVSAGPSTASVVRTNYGSSNRVYYMAWRATGVWANQAVGANDILTDTSAQDAWFVPIQLLGVTKGEGFVLRLRQMAHGPATTAPLAVYNTTGPVVSARQINAATAGGTGYPWLTNFKL